MDLTPRLKQIVLIMLETNGSISVQELAKRIKVSKRTVQRELEYIESSLKPYNIIYETKTGKGVWLTGSEEDKKRLLDEIRGTDNYDVSNREDRRKRLILEILKDKGLKKLFYYASQFRVSEATISSDLECVEGWLNKQNITIVRKPGRGIEVSGTEEDYRKAIHTFIDENIGTQLLKDSYEVNEEEKSTYHDNSVPQILDGDILKRVVSCLAAMKDKRITNLTENSYNGLILHISIAISRILKNEIMDKNEKWQSEIANDEDYRLAESISQKLHEEFEVDIPEIETCYICLHIKGSKHQGVEVDGEKTVSLHKKEMLNLINEMIDAYDADNSFIFKQDSEFIQGLLAHLQPTFVRLVHDMKIANPMLEEIKNMYPDIFEGSRRAAAVLEKWAEKPVPETEIGFLTIHFGAAKERMEGDKENIRQVYVGIVCASGIGISRLMQSKLDKIFKDRIKITTYGQNDITPYVIGKTDFFVSSIAAKSIDADVLLVNPLLSDDDIYQIRKKIFHYERIPREEEKENLFTVQLEQINILAMQIKTILRYMEVTKVSNDISFDELVVAISEQMAMYSDQQNLIQEDIEAREKLGSQIFAEFGFALLHTRTKGVVRPSFNVYMTRDGKQFNDPYFKGIGVVLVMLLPIDDNLKINSEILGYISGILIEDFDFLSTINGGSKDEIKAVLSDHLRKFFNQYISKI